MDHMNLDNEFAEMQETSSQVNEGTFISLDKATKVADSFFSKLSEDNVSTRSGLRAQKGSNSVETLDENGNPLMYIINYPDGGFVIIGSTTNYYPILAYSDKNSFDPTVEIGGLSEWLEETKEAIKTSEVLSDSIKAGMQNLWRNLETTDVISPWKVQGAQTRSNPSNAQIACWNRCEELMMQYMNEGWEFLPLDYSRQVFEYLGYPGIYEDLCYSANFNSSPIEGSVVSWRRIRKEEKVGPLLSTEWHQRSPFNDFCNGDPAGCSAIAVAQVMKYYQHPQSFTLNGYHFTWNTIPEYPNSNSGQAALVRLVGSVIDISYHSYGSWATPGNVKDGLKYLGYNVTTSSHDHWKVEDQLLVRKRPVIMVGNADNIPLPSPLNYIGNSHYWVCDGAHSITTDQIQYFTEWQPNGNGIFTKGWDSMNSPGLLGGIGYLYFHMNWGWKNGANNGWFAFADVNSGNGNFKHARQDFYITKP